MQLPHAAPAFECTVVSVAFSATLVDLLNQMQEGKPSFLLNPIQLKKTQNSNMELL